jgi:hypothetical protein
MIGHALAAPLSRWKTPEVAAPADLEALVREELREPVAALIRRIVPELVAEQVNGHANGAVAVAPETASMPALAPEKPQEAPDGAGGIPASRETSAGLRACAACGTAKPLGGFSPGHYTCKQCRRGPERERARRRAAAKADNGDPEG